MNAPEFDKIVNETCDSIRKVLSSKAKEYAKGDRLYNFKRAAEINHTTPELALAGMLVKHWVSVLDLIEGTLENTGAMVDEKIGDTINYLILLKAILQEKRAELNKYRSPVDTATYAFKETATRERELTEAVTISGHGKEAKPDPTERALGMYGEPIQKLNLNTDKKAICLQPELYKVVGKSPKGDFFLHISSVTFSKATEVADIRNNDEYDESYYRVFPVSQIVCTF